MDTLEMYEKASEWTKSKIAGAAGKLDTSTPCDDWDLRSLIGHCLEAQEFFAASGRGEEATPPTANVSTPVADDPAEDYEKSREAVLDAYRQPGAVEKAEFMLGIAFVDQLVHGWDIAKATGQDATMPEGLAEAAYGVIGGRLTDDNRGPGKAFKPEVAVPGAASAQDRLLGYSGRDPS